jgi:hypothetical protein
MTDQPTQEAAPAPARTPKRALRLPEISRNTGAYLLLLIALASAAAIRDHDLVERIIHDFLDIGLLVWGTRQQSRGDAQ